MILDKFIGDSNYDTSKVLLVHRVEEGEYEETEVDENSYICANEKEAADRIRLAAFEFCKTLQDNIDADTEFSIDYQYVTGVRRSFTVDYTKNGKVFREKLYITNPKT